MSFHEPGDTCPGCETKLTEACPGLQNWFREHVKPFYPDAHIAWAFRDEANQTLALKSGKSKLPWPLSKHNFTLEGVPCSKALDLFKIGPGNKSIFPLAWYKELAAEIKELGLPIRWGGTFISFPDHDHFQWEDPVIESKGAEPQTADSSPSPAPEKE